VEKPLWAPWRMEYILAPKRDGCIFCDFPAEQGEEADRRNLVAHRSAHAFTILNRFPYNPAHLMVAVARHAGSIADLTATERADWLDLAALAERILADAYRPHGVNYGANAGRVAGAGFPDHLHLHLVPRHADTPARLRGRGCFDARPEDALPSWRVVAAVEAVRRAI